MTGYLHASYAASLSEYGTPRFLDQSGSWILERSISGSPYSDAMGCYPIFACKNWSRLKADLENVGEGLVCLSLVTDPFGEYDLSYLRQCFPDLTIPFKDHFVVDLSRAPDSFVHPHHRRNARRALREVRVEECNSPLNLLEDWTALYATLVERRSVRGIAAFSQNAFARQLTVPGLVAFRAVYNDATVGMLLWYAQGNRAYYHLGAYSQRGYELRASFALFDYAIKYFAEHEFWWMNLGAGAGAVADPESGLSRFKQGWSTGTRTAYLCGRILNREGYDEIMRVRGGAPTKYFPAYRTGEFA